MPRDDSNNTKLLRRIWHRRETREAYRRMFESDDGRLILSDLLKSTQVARSSPPLGVEEANYRLGRQSVVTDIFKILKMTDAEIEALALEEYEAVEENERLG